MVLRGQRRALFVFVSSSLHNHRTRENAREISRLLADSRHAMRGIRKQMEKEKKTNSGCLGRMINFPERVACGSTGKPGELHILYSR